MPDYSRTKIYAIRSYQTDKVYVGHTIQTLSKRFSEHKAKNSKKETKAYLIFEYGDAYIELLERYPCNNVEEALKKEGEWRRKLDCVNKHRPGIQVSLGRQEYVKRYLKEYRARHPKIHCDCGGSYTHSHKTCHFKSKKHMFWAFDQTQVFNHL